MQSFKLSRFADRALRPSFMFLEAPGPQRVGKDGIMNP